MARYTTPHGLLALSALGVLVGCGGGAGSPVSGTTTGRDRVTGALLPKVERIIQPAAEVADVNATARFRRDGTPFGGAPVERPFDIDGTVATTGLANGGKEEVVTSGLGTFRLEVSDDLQGELVFPRAAQQQGDHIGLGVTSFFASKSLKLSAVKRLPGDLIQVDILMSHPFPVPLDLVPPATGTKRIDLHVFNLWLGTLTNGTDAFFGGTARTNVKAVTNADSYREVGSMVTIPGGVTANVFPGRWVADKSAANTDPALDNYDPNNGGWLGTQKLTSPTGFGVFPQGAQNIPVSFIFDPGTTGAFGVNFFVLGDYMDPRRGTTSTEKKANRLPDQFDPTNLQYVLPYGVGDVQTVSTTMSGNVPTTPTGSATCTVNIVDMDADFPTTPTWPNQADLSMLPFASGIASVEGSFPSLTGSTLTGTEAAGSGSGLLGSPKRYTMPVTNDLSAVEGSYYGLVRILDEENASIPSEPYFQLDSNLGPVPAGNILPIRVYQRVVVNVADGGGGAKIIVRDDDGPSYTLQNATTMEPAPWIDDPVNQHMGGLAIDDISGSQFFTFGGTGFVADDLALYVRGVFNIFLEDPSSAGAFNIELLAFANPGAGESQPRQGGLSTFHVSDGFVDTSTWGTPNPNAKGLWGFSDLCNDTFQSGGGANNGRGILWFFDDFNGYFNDRPTWTANHPTGFGGFFTNIQAGQPDEPAAHVGGSEQNLMADVVDSDFTRPGPVRNAIADDLVVVSGQKGPYNPSVESASTLTQVYTYMDWDDPDTPEVEPWGSYWWVGPTANSVNRPALFGAGPGSINPISTAGADLANDANRLYIADSNDDSVEAYAVLPDNIDEVLDGASQSDKFQYLSLTTAPGALLDPIDLTVVGDGAGGSLVVVLDVGGPAGNYRLLVLDPATLAVLGERDLQVSGDRDITTGGLAIAADESLINLPDATAFALIWNDPLGATPIGGMQWYTIADN